MAIIQYQVEVGADYSTLTTVVDNVQNVSLTYGRQKPLRRLQRKHRQRSCALPKRLHNAQRVVYYRHLGAHICKAWHVWHI
jgi:hypothetical protein